MGSRHIEEQLASLHRQYIE
ncbi:unnamed protein product [Medioppia subpectinata]|uniref:Uncharacterized protein n=1 Tax=Medioppia subpectinata TaxID=1979941 RepID=A0A7R9QLJ2_9ACAR|nr:unnamed protein product [Medioppia subpectinata]CAG2122372.1 unnamed protein product [Medioppia subpectinata]